MTQKRKNCKTDVLHYQPGDIMKKLSDKRAADKKTLVANYRNKCLSQNFGLMRHASKLNFN